MAGGEGRKPTSQNARNRPVLFEIIAEIGRGRTDPLGVSATTRPEDKRVRKGRCGATQFFLQVGGRWSSMVHLGILWELHARESKETRTMLHCHDAAR